VRQVKDCKVALQHNLGLGGAAVVALYRKAQFQLPGKRIAGNSTVGAPPAAPAPPLPSVPFETPKAATPAKGAAAAAAAPAAGGFQAASVFAEMKTRLAAEPDLVNKVKVVYRFDLTAGEQKKSWLVDLKNGAGSIKECDESTKAECMIAMKDADFILLMSGKLNAQQAFMKGQIRIKGNMMLAQKLDVLKSAPKAAAPAAAAAPKAAAAVGAFQASAVFAELAKRLQAEPDLVKKVGVVYRFDLAADGQNKSWLVDLKNGAGSIKESDNAAKADCMISMKDSDFILLMGGKLNAQQAFMKGQLKIKGNMMLAQKLDVLTKGKKVSANAAAAETTFQATAVFAELTKRLAKEPELVNKVKVVYRFDLSSDGAKKSWLVDLKNGAGNIKECDESEKADCILIMADKAFLELMSGKLNAQKAFMGGQLKIKGNMMLAQKLDALTKKKAAL